jgi:hypothetical protein
MMNNDLYLAVSDKLEEPDRAIDDLLVEAVGNDDGSLRKAIFRITLCDAKDLVSAQESLFNAFANYFGVDKLKDEIEQAQINAQYTDLIENGRYAEARKLAA